MQPNNPGPVANLSQGSSQGGPPPSSIGRFGPITLIKDLEPNQKGLNLQAIVLDIAKPTQTKDGHEVRTVRIADKSGSINLSLWNEYGAVLREGDIIRLSGCFTQIWKNTMQVKIGGKGQIVKCGEFMMVFNETPDMSILSADVLKDIEQQSGGGVGGSGGGSGGGPGGSGGGPATGGGPPKPTSLTNPKTGPIKI